MQNFLVFLGSARDSSPPRPARLGLRVARQCEIRLQALGRGVEMSDPLLIEFPAVFKPHFAYSKSTVPEALDVLAQKIEAADGYVAAGPWHSSQASAEAEEGRLTLSLFVLCVAVSPWASSPAPEHRLPRPLMRARKKAADATYAPQHHYWAECIDEGGQPSAALEVTAAAC
jgi:hypothetical protein